MRDVILLSSFYCTNDAVDPVDAEADTRLTLPGVAVIANSSSSALASWLPLQPV